MTSSHESVNSIIPLLENKLKHPFRINMTKRFHSKKQLYLPARRIYEYKRREANKRADDSRLKSIPGNAMKTCNLCSTKIEKEIKHRD